jgi:hypothetical protein
MGKDAWGSLRVEDQELRVPAVSEDMRTIEGTFRRAADVLTTAGVPWWIDMGSLLHAYRDGHLRDADLDIGTFAGIDLEVVTRGAAAAGFRVELRRVEGLPWSLKWSGGAVPVDVHLWQKRGDVYVTRARYLPPGRFRWMRRLRWLVAALADRLPIDRGLWPYRGVTWEVPAHHFVGRAVLLVGGLPAPTPIAIEEYLALHYGEAWRQPVEAWVWWRDGHAIVEGAARWRLRFRPWHVPVAAWEPDDEPARPWTLNWPGAHGGEPGMSMPADWATLRKPGGGVLYEVGGGPVVADLGPAHGQSETVGVRKS